MQDEKAEWIIYVTDEGQSGHFKLVFGSGKKAGIIPEENPPRIDHVGFGLVLGKDGKRIRTRDMGAVRVDTGLKLSKSDLVNCFPGPEYLHMMLPACPALLRRLRPLRLAHSCVNLRDLSRY